MEERHPSGSPNIIKKIISTIIGRKWQNVRTSRPYLIPSTTSVHGGITMPPEGDMAITHIPTTSFCRINMKMLILINKTRKLCRLSRLSDWARQFPRGMTGECLYQRHQSNFFNFASTSFDIYNQGYKLTFEHPISKRDIVSGVLF